MKKILINSLGCPKNLVDSEILAASFDKAGYELVNKMDEAETIVINTCSFIQPAVEEAIDAILQAASYKQNGVLKKLVVCGCLVERYKDQIMTSMPEVDLCIGIDGYNDIVKHIENDFETSPSLICGSKTDVSFMNQNRLLSDKSVHTYVKISEGCDNKCTYCTIPSIRGVFRSRTIEDILNEVTRLCEEDGIKEITLVAQDTTAYGKDIYGKPSLDILLKKLESIEKLKWIRLLYCYPELITDSLIQVMADSNKILHYIDMPLQHSSNRILKLMGRKGSKELYMQLIDKLRSKMPNIVLRSTFIVGFAQESQEDFEDLCSFLQEVQFDHAGFFEYYKEEGSAADKLPGHIESNIKKQRLERVQKIQQEVSNNKNKQRIGRQYEVLIEGVSEDSLFYTARSYAEAVEIDPVILVASEKELAIDSFVKINIVGIDDYLLVAEVIQ